jgi:hypothetical protein
MIDKAVENIDTKYGYSKSITDPKSGNMTGTLIAACSTQIVVGWY